MNGTVNIAHGANCLIFDILMLKMCVQFKISCRLFIGLNVFGAIGLAYLCKHLYDAVYIYAMTSILGTDMPI